MLAAAAEMRETQVGCGARPEPGRLPQRDLLSCGPDGADPSPPLRRPARVLRAAASSSIPHRCGRYPHKAPYVEPSQPIADETQEAKGEVSAGQTDSGIVWRVLRHGRGTVHPTANDSVRVHYEGWARDGRLFDSSRERGREAHFGLSKVIAGWTEVLQLMVVGDHWRVLIPADLAYGIEPKRTGAPAGDLTFEIELLEIIAAPAAPADVAAPPANAIVTASGLAYRVLKSGGGTLHPTAADKVEVHYSGWTTDGKMFDSSVVRGRPAIFPVNAVIKGWTETLQLMAENDTFRVWIPPSLAYGQQPSRSGTPAGMLVFDIELIRINP